METNFEIEAARSLASVRELSENATLRPAPNKLRTIPLRTFVIQPVPEWKRKWLRIEELINRKTTVS